MEVSGGEWRGGSKRRDVSKHDMAGLRRAGAFLQKLGNRWEWGQGLGGEWLGVGLLESTGGVLCGCWRLVSTEAVRDDKGSVSMCDIPSRYSSRPWL